MEKCNLRDAFSFTTLNSCLILDNETKLAAAGGIILGQPNGYTVCNKSHSLAALYTNKHQRRVRNFLELELVEKCIAASSSSGSWVK